MSRISDLAGFTTALSTTQDLSVGVITATSFSGDGSGLTGVASTDNIQTATDAKFLANVNITGITTATAGFVGALTGNATGLSGTPNITVGSVSAASGTFSGNVTIGGTLTYQDVTNIDAVGIITAQQGIQVLANGLTITGVSTFNDNIDLQDNDKIVLGTGDDLQIYHDGSDNYIKAGGNLEIWSTNVNLRNTDGSEYFLRAFNNGEVQLFHDNSEKLRTDLHGVKITGVCTATDFDSTSDARLKTNVQVVDGALSKVNELRGVSFNWIETGQPSYGVIAQELETVLPELVHGGDPKKVNYNGIIGVLIESIKELSARVDELENK